MPSAAQYAPEPGQIGPAGGAGLPAAALPGGLVWPPDAQWGQVLRARFWEGHWEGVSAAPFCTPSEAQNAPEPGQVGPVGVGGLQASATPGGFTSQPLAHAVDDVGACPLAGHW